MEENVQMCDSGENLNTPVKHKYFKIELKYST